MHIHRNAKRVLAAAMASLILSAAPAGEPGGEVLANSDIIGLSRARIAPAVVIAKIASSPNIFDLSSRGLMSLKENGVSDEIIAAMMAAGNGAAPVAAQNDGARFRQEMENLAGPSEERRKAATAWMLANRDQSLPDLRRALTDSRPEIRAAAVRALGDLRDRESVPAVRNLVANPAPQVRQAAAEALHALGDTQSVNAAEQALSRPVSPLDGYIRLVGHAKLTRTAAALGQILAVNPEPLNRAAAAWALGEIGRAATAGRPALEKALETDADADVRREAAAAVAKFHDPDGAVLLMNACRRDPEVRKTTLQAMAEYPETIEFLVSVMNLGADQIAVDELETARASLYRLTGQDFALDGQRWSSWFSANRLQLAPAPASGLAAGAAHPGATALPPVPLPQPQVDVEAWSIVADSAAIPMAPQVDDGGSAARMPLPGLPMGHGPAMSGIRPPIPAPGTADSSSIPLTLSPNEFDAIPDVRGPLPGYAPAAPQSIPSMDLSRGTMSGGSALPIPPSGTASASDTSGGPFSSIPTPSSPFQTWSSDPDRGAPEESRAPTSATPRGFPGMPGAPDAPSEPEYQNQWQRIEMSDDADEYADSPYAQENDASNAFVPLLPSSRVITPLPAADDNAVDDNPLRGLSLPIPGSTQSATTAAAAPPPPPIAATIGGHDDAEDFFSLLGDGNDAEAQSAATLAPYEGNGVFYDPAAAGENLLYGDELDGMIDVGQDDWAGATDNAPPLPTFDDGAAVASPFDVPDGLPMPPAGGDTVIYSTPLDASQIVDGFPVDDAAQAWQDYADGQFPVLSGEAEAVVQDAWEQSPNVIFVDPEPGQQLVGDNWTGAPTEPAGSPAWDAPAAPAAPVAPATPAAPAQAETPYVNPYGDNPANYPPPNPAYISNDPNFTPPPPKEYTEPYRPPQPQSPSAEPAQSLPGYGNEVFTDPSVPLPPVRPEGTVTAPQGKEMPPMLGEGLFK